MKKLLLTFMCLLGIISAAAAGSSYTIEFQGQTSGTGDGSEITTSDNLKNQLTSGSNEVSSFSSLSKVYSGKTQQGLKLGSGSAVGKFTINLTDAGKVKATKIIVKVAKYSTDGGNVQVKINNVTYTVNSSEMRTDVLEEHVFAISQDKQDVISTIEVSTSQKRAYFKSITITYGDDDGPQIIVGSNLDFGKAATGTTKKLNITAANLTEDITATWKTGGIFTCASSVDKAGGDLEITLAKTTKGACSDVLTLSANNITKTVTVSANVVVLEGNGSLENPYTVDDVILLNNGQSGNAWVRGYICGTFENNKFNAEGTGVTNIALGSASNSGETDVIPVELKKDTNIRDVLNITNTGNKGSEVVVYGNLEQYFGQAGVKSLTNYGFVEESLTLSDEDGFTTTTNKYIEEVEYTREVADMSVWHAICLPVEVPYDVWSSFYKVIKLHETQNNSDVIMFEHLDTDAPMEAYKPYLIKGADDGVDEIYVSITNVLVETGTAKTETEGNVDFIGTLQSTVLNNDEEHEYYGLKDGVFYHTGGNEKTMKPFRAYLAIDKAAATASFMPVRINGDVEEDGIEGINVDAMEDGVFYNVKGQRVDNPTSGLYIFNGHKVIIK